MGHRRWRCPSVRRSLSYAVPTIGIVARYTVGGGTAHESPCRRQPPCPRLCHTLRECRRSRGAKAENPIELCKIAFPQPVHMTGLDQERQLLRQHVGAVIKNCIRLHARRLVEELGDFVPAAGPQLW